jgi:hypothetical protein
MYHQSNTTPFGIIALSSAYFYLASVVTYRILTHAKLRLYAVTFCKLGKKLLAVDRDSNE